MPYGAAPAAAVSFDDGFDALISDVVDQDGANRIKLAWRFGMCLYHDGRYEVFF